MARLQNYYALILFHYYLLNSIWFHSFVLLKNSLLILQESNRLWGRAVVMDLNKLPPELEFDFLNVEVVNPSFCTQPPISASV
jgi:hypothetical protein